MGMRVVYIAGPIRAASAWLRELNIRRAEEAALQVWRAGAAALCVHTQCRFWGDDGTLPEESWAQGDLELLRRSDAVLMLPGWSGSRGSLAERREAQRVGLPVFFGLEEVQEWLARPSQVPEWLAAVDQGSEPRLPELQNPQAGTVVRSATGEEREVSGRVYNPGSAWHGGVKWRYPDGSCVGSDSLAAWHAWATGGEVIRSSVTELTDEDGLGELAERLVLDRERREAHGPLEGAEDRAKREDTCQGCGAVIYAWRGEAALWRPAGPYHQGCAPKDDPGEGPAPTPAKLPPAPRPTCPEAAAVGERA